MTPSPNQQEDDMVLTDAFVVEMDVSFVPYRDSPLLNIVGARVAALCRLQAAFRACLRRRRRMVSNVGAAPEPGPGATSRILRCHVPTGQDWKVPISS